MDKIFAGSSASYFITKQQCSYNSFEQKAFNANSSVWIMRAIYCPIYTTSLKTTHAPNWEQTPPQSFAVSAIIMGDMSLFIRANARQSITESHGFPRGIEQLLGDIPPYDLFIKPPFVSSETHTNESQMSGRTQPYTSFIILKTNSIHYAYETGRLYLNRVGLKATTAILGSKVVSSFHSVSWSIYGQPVLAHYERACMTTHAV